MGFILMSLFSHFQWEENLFLRKSYEFLFHCSMAEAGAGTCLNSRNLSNDQKPIEWNKITIKMDRDTLRQPSAMNFIQR